VVRDAAYLANGMERSRLNHSADQEDAYEDDQCQAPTDYFVGECRANGTEEAASGEQGDDVGRDRGVLCRGESGFAQRKAEVLDHVSRSLRNGEACDRFTAYLLERVESQDATHDAGIVT
jgi:hypothetical protein